jgi:bifunctional enzyme CysN/CysC
MGNVLYGVDADLDRTGTNRQEHFRRLGEIANLMLDAGVLLVVSVAALGQDELEIVQLSVPPERILTVWVGPPAAAGVVCDLRWPDTTRASGAVDAVLALLRTRQVIRPEPAS